MEVFLENLRELMTSQIFVIFLVLFYVFSTAITKVRGIKQLHYKGKKKLLIGSEELFIIINQAKKKT